MSNTTSTDRPECEEHGIDYRPQGTLWIDCRPITAEQFDHWRKQRPRAKWRIKESGGNHDIAYPSQNDLSFELGLPMSVVGGFLRYGLNASYAVAFRMWLFEGVDIINREFPADLMKAYVIACGGKKGLGDEVSKVRSTIKRWCKGGAPTHGGGGVMMWSIQQELELSPVEHIQPNPDSKLSASDVKTIIRRFKECGHLQKHIAADFGISTSMVSLICSRKNYRWVDV